MAVNGIPLTVTRTDQFRTLLGLMSTRFDVEETAKVTVLGSAGKSVSLPQTSAPATLTVIGDNGRKTVLTAEGYLITSGDGNARYATTSPEFRFSGLGFGHGVGMSQWGAFGLADLGYDYRKILQYYYQDAALVKG